jgi:hypothetical protein
LKTGANRYRGLEPRLLEQKMKVIPRALRRASSSLVIAPVARPPHTLARGVGNVHAYREPEQFEPPPKAFNTRVVTTNVVVAKSSLIESMPDEAHHG